MENILLSLADENLEREEGFKITDDLKADWALDKIREAKAEYARHEMVVKAKVDQLQKALRDQQQKMESEVNYFEGLLLEYMGTVKAKETKTQKTYSLPSGKLKLKIQKPEFVQDKDLLLPYVKANYKEFVKVEETVKWAELKTKVAIGPRQETIVDKYHVVNTETGEIIPGIEAVEREPKFEVEV